MRLLCGLSRGGLAVFSLAPLCRRESGDASHGRRNLVFHRRSWTLLAQLGGVEEITEIGPGVSISLPTGTRFQYRCDGDEPLVAVAVTMPPWPGADEAYPVGRHLASRRREAAQPARHRMFEWLRIDQAECDDT